MAEELDKDPAVLAALDYLRATLGAGAFGIVDHWEGDLTAVGIASPRNHRVLVYIATFPDGYYAELELPPAEDDALYAVAGRYSGLTLDRLAVIVADHLARA